MDRMYRNCECFTSKSITINIVNYSGEVANIIFKPNGINSVINIHPRDVIS